MDRHRLAFLIGVLVLVVGLGGVDLTVVKEQLVRVLGISDKRVELVAVGDVMLGRSVNTGMRWRNNWLWPFEKTAGNLRRADITFGNLEAPLVSSCPSTDTGMIFCGDKQAVKGLRFAGFDVVSVANNHIFNYGQKGFEETVEALKQERIGSAGNGQSYLIEAEGVRLAFLGFNDVGGRIQIENIEGEITEANAAVDIVVVSVHWGAEYTAEATKRQQELGHKFIDAGADLVLGHHPHWVQPVEEYKGGYIFYSLGNFVFDQMWSEETREGVAARIYLSREGVEEYELSSVRIYEYGQPRFEATSH